MSYSDWISAISWAGFGLMLLAWLAYTLMQFQLDQRNRAKSGEEAQGE